jgi:hypothetical protein
MSDNACFRQLTATWQNDLTLPMNTRGVDEAISQAWLQAGSDLGIRVTAPFAVRVSADDSVIYEAHVKNFGGPKGTVIGGLMMNCAIAVVPKGTTARILPPHIAHTGGSSS